MTELDDAKRFLKGWAESHHTARVRSFLQYGINIANLILGIRECMPELLEEEDWGWACVGCDDHPAEEVCNKIVERIGKLFPIMEDQTWELIGEEETFIHPACLGNNICDCDLYEEPFDPMNWNEALILDLFERNLFNPHDDWEEINKYGGWGLPHLPKVPDGSQLDFEEFEELIRVLPNGDRIWNGFACARNDTGNKMIDFIPYDEYTGWESYSMTAENLKMLHEEYEDAKPWVEDYIWLSETVLTDKTIIPAIYRAFIKAHRDPKNPKPKEEKTLVEIFTAQQ